MSNDENFAAAYREHYWAVSRYVARRLDGRSGEVEEVVAEVFTVAWRRRADLPAVPLPWLYGVARNCLANAVRGYGRRRRLVHRLGNDEAAHGRQVEVGPEADAPGGLGARGVGAAVVCRSGGVAAHGVGGARGGGGRRGSRVWCAGCGDAVASGSAEVEGGDRSACGAGRGRVLSMYSAAPSWLVAPTRRSRKLMPPAPLWGAPVEARFVNRPSKDRRHG